MTPSSTVDADVSADSTAGLNAGWCGLDIPAFYSRYFRPGMVDLSQSSPEPVPLDFRAAATEDFGAVRPPGGTYKLRAAIASRYERLNADDILVCSGASEALVALALSMGRDGEAVVLLGAYPSFVETLATLGWTQYATFEPAIRPTCAFANNPDAPAGHRFDVASFIEESARRGAVPIVDEVYRHIVLDGGVEPPAAADLDEAAVSVSGLSKSLGYGGLRVGWIATRNEDVKRRAERWLQLITGGPSAPSNALAIAALHAFDRIITRQQRLVIEHSGVVLRALQRFGWTYDPPALGIATVATPPSPVAPDAIGRALDAGYFLLPASVITGNVEDVRLRFSLLADIRALERALCLLA